MTVARRALKPGSGSKTSDPANRVISTQNAHIWAASAPTGHQMTSAHIGGSRAPIPAPPSPSVTWPGYRHAPTGAVKVSILVPR